MKKLLIATVLLLLYGTVFAGTNTTNFNLYKPGIGESSWGANVNANWDTIDNQLFIRVPVTAHLSYTLASSYGCASGWQSGALASEIATLVAAGINANYIFCVDVSDVTTVNLSPTGLSFTMSKGTPQVSVSGGNLVSPTGIYVTASLGTPTIAVSGGTVNLNITGLYSTAALGTATVGVSGGGATAVSDNFDRADSSVYWSSAVTYGVGSFTDYTGGALWYSLQSPNVNHAPTEDSYWSATPPTWSSGVSYVQGNVIIYSGINYIAIFNGINHQPDTSPTYWQAISAPVIGLGSNWTSITGTTTNRFNISGNTAAGLAAQDVGAYWSANTFNANHYAETGKGGSNEAYAGCAVRVQAGANSAYYVTYATVDEGDGYLTTFYYLDKVVAGTHTSLGSWGNDSGGNGTGFNGVIRLEANGTNIVMKTATSHGGTYTTRISVTDSALSGGSAGIYHKANTGSSTVDDWYGGDL